MKKILFFLITFFFTTTLLIATPQAIVFDFGGVMTGEPNREAVITFISQSFCFSKEEFEKANQEKRLAVKQGKTDEEFWISYAKNKGIKLPQNWGLSFKSVMRDAIGINPEMYALVDELKKRHISIALLSNIDDRLSQLIRDFGLYKPFNPCLLSCEIGVEKPDLKAYELLLTKLNLSPKEVLFIDDRLENIELAKSMGIDAVLFESEQQLRSELKKRGVLE